MKKLLSFLLCLSMILPTGISAKADETTVYVDPTGATAGAYDRLDLAAAALPEEGGTIVIKTDADTSLSSSSPTLTATGKIRIVGASSDVRLTQKRALIAACDLEIDNLTLVNGASNSVSYIYAQGNDLTIGENVTTVKNSSDRYLSIFAGKSTSACTGVECTITIGSGAWYALWLGNNTGTKAFSGSVDVELGACEIEYVALSGNTGASSATVTMEIDGADIGTLARTRGSGTFTGTETVTYKSGTIGTLTSITLVDLSEPEEPEEATVYLDPAGTGSHTEHVYTTLAAAVDALPSGGGTIVVCSNANINVDSSTHYYMAAKKIRITGETSSVRLTQLRSFYVNEDFTIDNITWVNSSSSSYAFAYAQGHDFTVGENVTCVPNGSVYLCILAGSSNASGAVGYITDADSTITVMSGRFRRIFGGGLNRSFTDTVTINLEGGTVEDVYLAGSGSAATVNGNGTIVLDGATVTGAIDANSASGVFTGTSSLTLKSGTVKTISNLTPVIDLSDGGTLTLNNSVTAGSVIGGGKIILGNDAALTAASFTGAIDLEVGLPSGSVTYFTVNDASSTGTVNYIPKGNETMSRTVTENTVEYMIGTAKTHVKIVYYNPEGAGATQPSIVLYKGYSTDTDKVKITDLETGTQDGYKSYVEADLDPGFYYYLVYYSTSSDYARKYFYVSGEEASLNYDFPLIPITVNSYQEKLISITTDEILEQFWDFSKTNVDDFTLVTPTFTQSKYTSNLRAFMDNDDLCDFVDSLSSPYLHVYYPFELTALGNKCPVLVFTKDSVSSGISLADLADEISSQGVREVLMINGGQHGNEPSGIDGSLQLAWDLCGEYGDDILDSYGAIVIIPCVSVDNNQRFAREYPDGLNSNRDLLYLSKEGSQNIAYIYDLFRPTVFISAHEDNETLAVDTSDNSIANLHNLAYECLTIPNSPIYDTESLVADGSSMQSTDSVLMTKRLIDKSNAQGFRATHYPTLSFYPVAEKAYAGVRGSYAFLIEVQRMLTGKANYEYSVKEMVTAIKNIIEEVIDMDEKGAETIAQKVYNGRESAKVTEYSDDRLFVLSMSYATAGSDPYPSAYVDGTYKDAAATKNWNAYSSATSTRSLPLSYVIPADLENIDNILALLDAHGIDYTEIEKGTTRVLKEYGITDSNGDRSRPSVTIGENSEVTFENGAYEISMNSSDAYLITYLFEPDSYNSSTLYYISLYKMGYIDESDHLYRYETNDIPTGDPSTVTFISENSTYSVLSDVTYNSLIEAPEAPEKSGYLFMGWYKDSGFESKWFFGKDRVTADTTLYAKFEVGHTITVIGAGLGNTSHSPVESAEWHEKTGGEVNGAGSYVTAVGDYSNTTGVGLSIYTQLSDVTAMKIKVGNSAEQTIEYSGSTLTRYLSGENAISTTGSASTDIVKFYFNKSTSTLISSRFYNIKEDIVITIVHNELSISCEDSGSGLISCSYDRTINGYTPDGNTYSVPVTSLNAEGGNTVNMHLDLAFSVPGIKISAGGTDVIVYAGDSVTDISFGKIIVSSDASGDSLTFDVLFDMLNCNVTVSPVYEIENPSEELRFTGASLTLESNLKMKFVFKKTLADIEGFENIRAEFEVGGKIVSSRNYSEKGSYYSFGYSNISPDSMGDVITARLYATYGGEEVVGEVLEYSISDYCYMLLEQTDDAKLKTLIVDLLNFGAASQYYTGHNTGEPVNAALSEAQASLGTTDDPVLTSVTDTRYRTVSDPEVTISGAYLNVSESINIRILFSAQSKNGLTVRVENESGEIVDVIGGGNITLKSGHYDAAFNGLNAAEMSNTYYFTVYRGETPISDTLAYSIESYAFAKQNSSYPNLAPLVKAMMKYGNAARAYAAKA